MRIIYGLIITLILCSNTTPGFGKAAPQPERGNSGVLKKSEPEKMSALLQPSTVLPANLPNKGIISSAAAKKEVTGLPPEVQAAALAVEKKTPEDPSGYLVGVDDILTINVLRPETIMNDVTVSPDGSISFPYIGNVNVKGMTINQVQQEIEKRLADGYLKYPSVVVSLKESRSRKFFVYGEVNKPGSYPMDNNTTVLRAISSAAGFTKFGSASRVKVLRLKPKGVGYETIQVNIRSVMQGDAHADLILEPGDIVVVSEGIL